MGENNEENVITVVYTLDANEDGTPDKYQVKVTYNAEVTGNIDESEGTEAVEYVTIYRDGIEDEAHWAEPGTESAFGKTRAEGVKATPAAGYMFMDWAVDGIKVFDKAEPAGQTVTQDTVFTARFIGNDQTYTVKFVDEDGNVLMASEERKAKFDDIIEARTLSYPGTISYESRNYMFETVNPKSLTVGENNEENVMTVVYTLDANEDGTPDKYQIEVTYSAENGSIDATHVNRVFYVTLFDENGNWATAEDGGVGKLEAEQVATATPNVNHQAADRLWTPSTPTADMELTIDTHFTAHYVYVAPYNPGGDGGGSTGGGESTTGRFTESSGGPGVAVTITPDDVPLAQLPGAPVDLAVIDDGEIPLAALPKTGQSSVKSTLTMMMSGIFLILTAMGKRRKDEESQ